MSSLRVFSDTDRCRLGQFLSRESCRPGAVGRVLDNLEWELEQASLLAGESVPDFVITMHTRVRVRSQNTGREVICALVYPDEVELFEHGLSVMTPLGSRLIGRCVGDLIEWELPHDRGPWQVREILSHPTHGNDNEACPAPDPSSLSR